MRRSDLAAPVVRYALCHRVLPDRADHCIACELPAESLAAPYARDGDALYSSADATQQRIGYPASPSRSRRADAEVAHV